MRRAMSSLPNRTRFVIKTINKISPAGLARFSPERYRIKPAEDEPEVAHAIMLRSHKMTDADVPLTTRAIARCVRRRPLLLECAEARARFFLERDGG